MNEVIDLNPVQEEPASVALGGSSVWALNPQPATVKQETVSAAAGSSNDVLVVEDEDVPPPMGTDGFPIDYWEPSNVRARLATYTSTELKIIAKSYKKGNGSKKMMTEMLLPLICRCQGISSEKHV